MPTTENLVRVAAATILLCSVLGCLEAGRDEADEGEAGPAAPGPRERRLTDWPGTENAAEFSPDGAWIAFDAAVGGQTDIHVMHIESGETRQLTDASSVDREPDWSPDGRTIFFQSTRGETTGIWSLPFAGGEPTPVFVREGVRSFGPDVSVTGELVITVVEPDASKTWGRATSWVMNADGGAARSVTRGGDEWWGRWGPKGEWVYYFGGFRDPIEAVNVESGEVKSITRGRHIGFRQAVSIDGRVAFVSSPAWSLWLRSEDLGAELIQLTSAIGGDDAPSFSPDGRQLVFSSDRARGEIVAVDLASGGRRSVGQGTSPQPLADGSIAFLTQEGDDAAVVIASASGAADRRLEPPVRGIRYFAIAPSLDRWALVATGGGPTGGGNLFLADLDGTDVQKMTDVGNPGIEAPAWCGERLLGYTSYRNDLVFRQIFRVDVVSGETSQLTDSPASKRLTDCFDDGDLVSFRLVAGDRGVYSARRSGEIMVETLRWGGSEGSLSPSHDRLAYVAREAGRTDVFVREPDGSVVQVTDDGLIESGVRWLADGTGLVFSARAPGRDLWLLDLPPASSD